MEYQSHLHRLFAILTLIQGKQGWTASMLAGRFGVVDRTIHRDMDVLRQAGVPIDHDPESGGYVIARSYFLRPIDLTLDEALSLLILSEQVGSTEQIPHLGPAQRAAEKVRAVLPGPVREELGETLSRISLSLARSSNEPTADVADRVQTAINTRRSLECTYESPNRKSADAACFRFDPYKLHFDQRAWFAIGLHHGYGQVRTLKLSRFTQCLPTDRPYAIPDDFSLTAYFGKAWRMIPSGTIHSIKLRFEPPFGETAADTHWHDSQQVEYLDDGAILMHFEVDGLEEIMYWIMG